MDIQGIKTATLLVVLFAGVGIGWYRDFLAIYVEHQAKKDVKHGTNQQVTSSTKEGPADGSDY